MADPMAPGISIGSRVYARSTRTLAMFRYDIVENIDGATVTLATFEAPWAESLPVFHEIVRAYFSVRRSEAFRELLFYATLEGQAGEPDRTSLVCAAQLIVSGSEPEVEIRAGPLLEAALRRQRH